LQINADLLMIDPERMLSGMTRKFTVEVDVQLHDELVVAAQQNGQTEGHVLEQALRFYLHNGAPSQQLVRRAVMDTFEQSLMRDRDLLQRLAVALPGALRTRCSESMP
jgi:hypothetical protein